MMIEQDTIRLLQECDAGIKMGIASIDDVSGHAKSRELRQMLITCRQDHAALQQQIRQLLDRYQDAGKDPNPMARLMSRLKTGIKLHMKESDAAIADLMTDGCNMGVKSLSKYLNQYRAADETSKDITKQLIALEERLAVDIRGYL